jgi:hypothetical protein
MRDNRLQRLEKWAVIAAALVTVVGFPLLLISLWFAYHLDVVISQQLAEIKRIAQSENSIALNTMVFNDYSNAGIISTIQNDKPLLIDKGGKYTTVDLDKYLGAFNTVALVYRDGFLSDDHLCASFAFYVKEALQNSEVQKYMAENAEYFGGFRDLLTVIKNSNSPFCQPYRELHDVPQQQSGR